MPSSFTDSLRLEKQADGENDSTWGDKLNVVLDLIEAAIAGRAAVTHDDTANYTLTTANSAADEARNMILTIGGALTADRNVVCPTKSKLYVVKNATTGGHSITLKTSGGTGVAVLNGKLDILICDGVNVVKAADYATLTGAETLLNKTLTAPLNDDGAYIPTKGGIGKNQLINPAGAIYSRTATATADDTYFADSWYMLTQTNTVTPSVLTDPEDGYPLGVRITQSQAVAQRFGYAQIVESLNCRHRRSRAECFSPRIRVSNAQAIRYALLEWVGTADAVTSDCVNDWTNGTYTGGNFFVAANFNVLVVGAVTPSASAWTSLSSITANCGASMNNLLVMVWTEGTAAQNFTLDFDAHQLEAGSVATEFEYRTNEQEQLLCWRYLPTFIPGANGNLGAGQVANTQTGIFPLKLPVRTRAPITGVTASSAGHFAMTKADTTLSANCTGFGFGTGNQECIEVDGTLAAGALVQGNATTLYATNTSAKLICTGAEL